MPSPTGPRTPSLYHFEPAIAGAIVAGAMAVFLTIGAIVPRDIAIIASQIALAAVPLGAAILWSRSAWPRTLGLRIPHPIYVVAAVLVGSAAWYVNLRIVELLPFRASSSLENVVENPPLITTLITLVVVPPICEEILFRGVFARGLARGVPRTVVRTIFAIVISAALFSLYHLSPVQALPTFTLGILLAWITLRADSIVPAIVVHALNNLMAVIIARDEVPALSNVFRNHANVALAGSVAVVGAGIAVAAIGPKQ